MAKIDKVKETLNSLRVGLSIISALLIALGGALGSLYKNKKIDFIFWISSGLFFILLITIQNAIPYQGTVSPDKPCGM